MPATKRGADLVALDDALDALAQMNRPSRPGHRAAFFGGLSAEETASVLRISPQSTSQSLAEERTDLTPCRI